MPARRATSKSAREAASRSERRVGCAVGGLVDDSPSSAAWLAQPSPSSLRCGHTCWSRKFSTVVITWPRTRSRFRQAPGGEHAVIGPVNLQDVPLADARTAARGTGSSSRAEPARRDCYAVGLPLTAVSALPRRTISQDRSIVRSDTRGCRSRVQRSRCSDHPIRDGTGGHYDQTRTDTDRKLRNHIRQIQALGFEVTLTKTRNPFPLTRPGHVPGPGSRSVPARRPAPAATSGSPSPARPRSSRGALPASGARAPL